MLKKDNFTKENIEKVHLLSGNDPSLIEKTIYAFGLLEAISKVGMPFIFKGGSCLMLLFDKPQRLSTDIDIIVEPDTDVQRYIEEAGQLFPFKKQEESVRRGKNNIEKRHYEFTYDSPVNKRPLVILLDILFEKNHYKTLLQKPVRTSLLSTEGNDYLVKIPDANSILGDKLTAFAPHTTGIRFKERKELEIIKQLYDCYSLIKIMNNYEEVAEVYRNIARTELGYRGLDMSVEDVLRDTISSCFCIISKGAINKNEYTYFADGIRKISGHIFGENFNGDRAAYAACEVLYLVTCIYTGNDYKTIDRPEMYLEKKLEFRGARSVNYLRKTSPQSFIYVARSAELLDTELEALVYDYEKYIND